MEAGYVEKEGDKGLWAPWSSNRPAEATIMIDGVRINEVFTKIRKQLESLKGQQQKDALVMESLSGRIREEFEVIKEKKKEEVEQAQKEHEAVNGAEQMQLVIDIQLLRDEQRSLATTVETQDKRLISVEKEFKAFKPLVEGELAKLNSCFQDLSEKYLIIAQEREDANEKRIKLLEISQVEQDQRFLEYKNDNAAEFVKLGRRIKTVEDSKAESNNHVSDATLMLDEIREEMALLHLKMQNNEEAVTHTLVQVATHDDFVNGFITEHLDPMRDDIKELQLSKADKSELLEKAGYDDMMRRVKQSDDERVLREEDVSRRTDQLDQELKYINSSIDQNLEQKSEKIALWCLKVLKKQLKGQGGGGAGGAGGAGERERDGANIGKVKCLVCDQPTNQNAEPANMVFGATMKNTTGYKHTQVYALEKGEQGARPTSPILGDQRNKRHIVGNMSPEQIDQRRSWSPSYIQSNGGDSDVNLVLVRDQPVAEGEEDDIGMRTSSNFQSMLPKITTPHRSKLVRMGAIPIPDEADAQRQALQMATVTVETDKTGALVANNRPATTSPTTKKMSTTAAKAMNAAVEPRADDDFNYRLAPKDIQIDAEREILSGGSYLNEQQQMLAQSQQQNNQMVDMMMDTNPLLPNQQRNTKYFKDLEQRFASGGARKTFSNVDETLRIRPITAPLRPLLSRSQQGI